ncbi:MULTISPECIES: triose-phosphate isomerase [Vibrio]|uniref:triose-phosphate isomerase n=1 Tax=Vibrio TaxID=662 RepID=UPI0001541530|nr:MULTISPECIES: triose-phosphate isomerase [Vibrio]EDL53581.1 Triosephosphate isomerase [Vibrio mediterranei AK1]MCY9869753.1 triose-phosphate isomerase [Vibrio barjaei]OIN27669.1 triose-phosphate isomerase [Vibrio barjaei]
MTEIRAPFIAVNPKSYLYGDKLLAMAKKADELAIQYDLDIFFTAQHVDLRMIKDNTSRLIVTAQHMDPIEIGRGMGHILPNALVEAGVGAVFLNHAERPLTLAQLVAALKRTKELGLFSIVCADSLEDAQAIAMLHPDVMVCEPTELIGTGQTANKEYILSTQTTIAEISPKTLGLQAAGISSPEDVEYVIKNGAHGTGATSGIFASEDPMYTMVSMIEAVAKGRSLNS